MKITDSLLVFFTLVLACFTGKLWASTDNLVAVTEDLHKMAKRQEHSTEAIERAYIFSEIHLGHFANALLMPQIVGSVNARVQFCNYGKTPAVVSLIRGYIEISNSTPQEYLQAAGTEMPLPPSLGIASNDSYPISLDKELSFDELGEVSRLEKRIFFVGRMDYRTVVGNKPCSTGFCWELVYRDKDSFVTVSRDSALNSHT